MRTHRPRHVVALTVVGSAFLAGCIFNNTIHNAQGLYGEAENLRLAGQDSAGSVRRYQEAQAILDAIRRVELLTEYGFDDEPIALVAAAEISRDVLAARLLSAALFQAYAAAVPDAPWSRKALLASRELTTDPARRRGLDQRIEALPEDAYVRYARDGRSGPELGALESGLQGTLDQLLARVDEELSARRQLTGVPKK